LKNTRPSVTNTVTMAEFWNQTGKSELRNSLSNAAVDQVCGIREIGLVAASTSVLKDVATCTKNGEI